MKKATLTRAAALLLALCLTLPACQNDGGEESSQPKTMAEAQREKAAASALAEKENEDQEVLRVVTDLDCRSKLMGQSSQASRGKQTFQTILRYFGGVPSGIKVKLDVLPMDEGGAYDSELTHIRTEIAAGSGPDVFLMSGFGGPHEGYCPANTLFQSPEAAMKKGLFLPLDEYIETAQHMDLDKLDQKVMEAGRNEQGQVILPMFYRLDEAVLNKKADPATLPTRWQEAASSQDESITELYALGLALSGFRYMCFGPLADHQSEELLITQDELFQRAKEAVDLYKRATPRLKTYETMADYLEQARAMLAYNGYWFGYLGAEDISHSSHVFYNSQGEINAAIETWCAVNKNTQHPEDAFAIVDMLMSREFLGQEAFWNKQPTYRYNSEQMTFFYLAGEGFQPVHKDLLSGPKRYKYNETINTAQKKVFSNARDSIGCPYFTSNLDREMDRLAADLLQRVYDGGDLTDEELRKETDKCYTTLKMMLAES